MRCAGPRLRALASRLSADKRIAGDGISAGSGPVGQEGGRLQA